MKPHILGLTGYMGSGKTTAAQLFIQHLGYRHVPFAGPLKAMLVAAGVPHSNLHGSPEEKEAPLPMLGGRSARHAMQTLGTEWGRNLIHPDLWTLLWKNSVHGWDFVVVDDVRFPNEAALIRGMGGMVVRIHRPGTAASDVAHDSERFIRDILTEAVVGNTGSEMDLYFRVLSIVNERYRA